MTEITLDEEMQDEAQVVEEEEEEEEIGDSFALMLRRRSLISHRSGA